MKLFYLTFFLCLAAAAALNYVMDPAAYWHKPAPILREAMPPGTCMSTREIIDERQFKVGQLKTIPTPDLLLLSSSRGFQIRSSHFPTLPFFYNGSMSGSAIEDYAVLWQQLKEQGKTPKRIVVFFDDSQFFDKTPTYRWYSVRGQFYRFLSSYSASGKEFKGLRWVQVSKNARALLSFAGRVADLFSFGALKQSVRNLRDSQFDQGSAEFQVVPVEQRNPSAYCWGAEGSLYYPDFAYKPASLEELIRNTVQSTTTKEMQYLYNYETNAQNYLIVRKLLAEFKESGISVMIMIPPYQPDGYAAFRSNLSSSIGMDKFRADVASLATEFSIPFRDHLDPASLDCKSGDFMDIEHPIGNCLENIVKEITKYSVSPVR